MFHKFLILINIILIFTIQLTAREIKFTFNPPDNLEYQTKIRITKTTDLDGQHKRVEITESSMKVKIKKNDNEYIITNTSGPTRHYRDGQETDHPIFSLLSKVIVTYHVDLAGQIISVNGFDKLMGLMQENLPPQLVQQLAPILTEAALVQKEKIEWNGRFGIFAGAAVNVGDVFTIEEQQPLPNGKSVPLYSAIVIDSLLIYDNKECLRITYTYHSNPENLANLVGITVQNIYESLGKSAESIVLSDITIEGEGERIIDPQTMLIYHEKIKRTTQMQMEVPEMGLVPVVQVEEREYEFDY